MTGERLCLKAGGALPSASQRLEQGYLVLGQAGIRSAAPCASTDASVCSVVNRSRLLSEPARNCPCAMRRGGVSGCAFLDAPRQFVEVHIVLDDLDRFGRTA